MQNRKRKSPLPLQKLKALIPRLSPHYSGLPKIHSEIAIRKKGYIGERKIDYYLNQLPYKFLVLHDICLKIHGHRFQMDSLLISDYAIYIIESKNFTGTITFHTNLQQFTRLNGNQEEGFSYPITQAENTQLKLTSWLEDQNFHHVRVQYFIGISEPSTIIKVVGDEQAIARVVAHAEHLPKKIMDMDESWSDGVSRRAIGRAILQKNRTFDFDILSKLNVQKSDILPGVICPRCKELRMIRIHSRWTCRHCDYQSRRAHITALSDYFLLMNGSITNKACRYFLNIDSRHLANRLLKSAKLTYNSRLQRWER